MEDEGKGKIMETKDIEDEAFEVDV